MDTTPGFVALTNSASCGCVYVLHIDAETWTMGWTAHVDDITRCATHEAEYQDYRDEMAAIDAAAEQAAELRNEQYWENRGWAEATAFEDWERSRGVLSYEQARDLAMGV